MESEKIAALGFTWDEAVKLVQSTGVEFGINIVTAIAIFYFGKLAVAVLMRGLHKVIRTRHSDDVFYCCSGCSWPCSGFSVAGLTGQLRVRCTDRSVSALQSW